MAKREPTLQARKTQVKMINSAHEKKPTRFMPANKDIQDMLGDMLIAWSKQSTSESMDQFFSLRDIGHYNFTNACKTNAYLDECYNIALQNLGLRLRENVKSSFEFSMKEYAKYETLARIERKERLAASQEAKETEYKLTVNRG